MFDLSDIKYALIVGAKRDGCSISETATQLGFSYTYRRLQTGVRRIYGFAIDYE